MIYTILDGVKYKVMSGDADDLDRNLPAIRADIASMRATQTGEQKWFHHKDKWDIYEAYGQVEVIVYGAVVEKKQVTRLTHTVDGMGYEYVLLVEMGDGLTPTGFAIFGPGPSGELIFEGFTEIVDPVALDPPGLVGQTTYRQGWCNGYVVQVPRVDQGAYAYDGDEDLEEVTLLYYEHNLWTYEDIAFPTHWENVDPGPPDPVFCGYTWSPELAYGGTEADYHDIKHLFYGVEHGGSNQLIAWWPPNFTQKLTITQRWHIEGGLFRNIDKDDPGWYSPDYSLTGVMAAVGHIIFPCSYTQTDVTADTSIRAWGLCWGNETFFARDIAASDAFPHTDYAFKKTYSTEAASDYMRIFCPMEGVYLYSRHKEIFIQGVSRFTGGGKESWTRSFTRRDPVDIDERFVAETHPREPLTEAQLEVLKGNVDAAGPWVYDYFTNLYYAEEFRDDLEAGEVCVNIAGVEHPIFQESVGGGARISGWFDDYGIFTKVGKGITKDGEVDPWSVDPIYAHSVFKAQFDTATGAYLGADKIIYGMELDGEYYKTEEFDWGSGHASIPGTEKAKGRPNQRVRVGRKVVHSKLNFEVEI